MPLNGPSSSASNASNALSPYMSLFDKFLTCQWDWEQAGAIRVARGAERESRRCAAEIH